MSCSLMLISVLLMTVSDRSTVLQDRRGQEERWRFVCRRSRAEREALQTEQGNFQYLNYKWLHLKTKCKFSHSRVIYNSTWTFDITVHIWISPAWFLSRFQVLVNKKSKYFGGDSVTMIDYLIWPWFERFAAYQLTQYVFFVSNFKHKAHICIARPEYSSKQTLTQKSNCTNNLKSRAGLLFRNSAKSWSLNVSMACDSPRTLVLTPWCQINTGIIHLHSNRVPSIC